jgi:hypothetical protein
MASKFKTFTLLGLALALLTLLSVPADAQSVPLRYLSVAGTPVGVNITTNRSILTSLLPVNTTATTYYLKLYDTATVPTCGSGTPKWTVPIPAAAASSASAVPVSPNIKFVNGIGICLTGALADTDTMAAAVGVVVNFGVSGY